MSLTAPQGAVEAVLAPRLHTFAAAYPDVVLEVSIDDGFVDIVREGFDAGIRLGESVSEGMTALRVSEDARAAVVASPGYWAAHPPPPNPRDLRGHLCINRRYGPGRALYRWRFARGSEELEVACEGPLVLNFEPLIRAAALGGAGVAMVAEEIVASDIAAGRLVRVLEDWCPPLFGFFLYHSSSRLPSASLRALVAHLTLAPALDPADRP